MISKSYFNQKIMVWLCHILKEASKVNAKIVRRWKLQEQMLQIFYARNYNKQGRKIRIISI